MIALFRRQLPKHAGVTIDELHDEIFVDDDDAMVNIVDCNAQHFKLVDTPHNIGNLGIAQHPSAPGQRYALEAQHLPLNEAHAYWRQVAPLHTRKDFLDVLVQSAR